MVELDRPRDEATALLGEQIEKGQALIDDLQTDRPLEDIQDDGTRWASRTEHVLRRCFTDPSLATQFDEATNRDSPRTLRGVWLSWLRAKLAALGSVYDRLDLFDEASHLSKSVEPEQRPSEKGISQATAVSVVEGPPVIFLGHGANPLWREVKDELEHHGYAVEEFTSVSPVGVATKERLEALLSRCNFAVLLMTADDSGPAGARARQNVVHEAGLFQGRYGFARVAVVLLDGVEEFSNIHGLGQVRADEAGLIANEVIKQLRREFRSRP